MAIADDLEIEWREVTVVRDKKTEGECRESCWISKTGRLARDGRVGAAEWAAGGEIFRDRPRRAAQIHEARPGLAWRAPVAVAPYVGINLRLITQND